MSAQDRRVHDLEHGTYVRIQVPPPDGSNIDTEVAIGLARDLAEDVCRPAMAFPQLSSGQSRDEYGWGFKTDPTQEQVPPIYSNAADHPAPRRVYNHRDALPYAQRRQLLAALRDADPIECEEEGRIMYLTTWYLHHTPRPRCYEGKPVRLTDEQNLWLDELLEPWGDLADPDQPFSLRVVQPNPPCSRMECVQAHVIIEQGEHPHSTPILGSIQDQPRDAITAMLWEHRAYAAADLQNVHRILRPAELQARCATAGFLILPFSLSVEIIQSTLLRLENPFGELWCSAISARTGRLKRILPKSKESAAVGILVLRRT